MRPLRILFILLILVTGRVVLAHDEPFIVCDVTVIDTVGNPVVGAEVFAIGIQWISSEGIPLHEKTAEVVTHTSGQARLQWPNSEKDYFVIAYKPGLSVGWSLVRCWNPRQRIILQLGKVIPLSGTVVDEDGRPVADALVQCKPQSSSEFNFSAFGFSLDVPFLKTQTDTDGRFTFQVMSEDMTTDFFVTHPQFAPHFTNARSKAFNCTHRPGQEGIVITLSKGCTVRGKVADEAGKGLAGIPIHARLNDASSAADYSNYFSAVSEKDGTFILTNLPEETFLITTGGSMHDEQSRWPSFGCMVHTHKDKPVRAAVKVEKGFPVEFVVIEAETKHLIPNASVDLGCSLKPGNTFRSIRTSGKTDGSGRLTLPWFPGTCTVTAWAKGYNGMWPTPVKIDKNTKRIPIFLTPEQLSVSGKVVDAAGKPVVGIRVYPVPGTEKNHALTDHSGRFALQFQPMSKQVYLLAQDIEQNLYALVEVTEEKTEYMLRLQKGLIVKGKVTDRQGRTIQGAMIEQRCYVPNLVGLMGYKTLSDRNGDYTFQAVPPTQGQMVYSFRIFAAGYGSDEIKKVKINDQTGFFNLPELQLSAIDCSVRGIVVDEKGNPMPNLNVHLQGSRGSRTAGQPNYTHVSDSEGRFFFPNVCRGPIQIQAGWASDNPGFLRACGGDQNLKVVFHKTMVHPEHPAMIGRPIPPLCFDGRPVDLNQLEGKHIVVCFWNPEAKMLKRACDFSQQLDSLSQDDVSAHFVFIYSLSAEDKKKTLKQISWLVYDSVTWTEMDLLQRAWGAQEIPWFVVTDKQHVIIYEGTSPDEAKAALPLDGSRK